MSHRITRRRFIERSGRSLITGGAVMAGMTAASASTAALGANEKISLAFIGCGRRGNQLLDAFLGVGGIRVAAVCDVNDPRAESMRQRLDGRPDAYHDYRDLLGRRDIDAVVVATDCHWHCLPTVEACQAGKDVYVEKPLGWCIGEGRIMVEATRRHDRIVMVGTQQRNMACFQEAVEYIHAGRLGKISEVRMWNVQNIAPAGFGNPPNSDPPAGLDWDFWLGPAPKVPYNPNRCGKNASIWFWDYGGGYVTDWGTHLHDVTHWAMQEDKPLSVCAMGGRFSTHDNTEVPDTIDATFEYRGFVSHYHHRRGNGRHLWREQRFGSAFYGEKGTLFLNRQGWEVIPEPVDWYVAQKQRAFRCEPLRRAGSPEAGPHQKMFLDAVRAHRKLPTADVEMGHLSTIPGHLANISYRTGHKIRWDAENETIKDDPEANKLLTREYRKPWVLPTL